MPTIPVPGATRLLSGRLARILASGAALAVLSPALVAAGARAATLTVYAAQHEQTVDIITEAFTKATGIEVKVRAGEPPELASQLLKEGAQSPADVFLTGNSPELTLLSERGMLAPVEPATLARVPEKYSAPGKDWVGVTARVNVLVFDPRQVKEADLPTSLMDLAKPEWKGRLAISPTDADFLPLVGAVVAAKGRDAALDWLRGLRDNAALFDDNEAVAAAVERGSAAVGIVNNYYQPRLAVEKGEAAMQSKVHYFGGSDIGGLVNVSGAGLLKSSKHPAEARRFLAFLVSDEVQRELGRGDVTFEYPLVAGIAAHPVLPAFASLQPPAVSIEQLGDDRESAKLLREAGLI